MNEKYIANMKSLMNWIFNLIICIKLGFEYLGMELGGLGWLKYIFGESF